MRSGVRYLPPGKEHTHIVENRRGDHQEPDLESLRHELQRRQHIMISLIQPNKNPYVSTCSQQPKPPNPQRVIKH